MRVALYEGTWEKYHKGTDFAAAEDKSTDLLGQVLTLGDELFTMGLSLNTRIMIRNLYQKKMLMHTCLIRKICRI